MADGGTALDPEVVSQLFRASRQRGGLATLTPRERQVLALMAEGRSNAGIAAELVVSGGAVEKHVASIFSKLGLPPGESDNRRVLAVLRYLGGTAPQRRMMTFRTRVTGLTALANEISFMANTLSYGGWHDRVP